MKIIVVSDTSEEEKKTARNEVDVLKSVNHDNLVRYEEDFYEDGKFLIVMEFCSGGDLSKAIKEQKRHGHFAEDIVLSWSGQLIAGLRYMKENHILHRDLKPSNIFLTSDRNLKIGDFGLAKVLDRTSDMAVTRKGTRIYMAPEILSGQKYQHKVDVWALGCVLYELCTLKYTFTNIMDIPFGQYQPIPSGLHPMISPFVPRLLCVDPKRRPSADQILTR